MNVHYRYFKKSAITSAVESVIPTPVLDFLNMPPFSESEKKYAMKLISEKTSETVVR